MTQCRSIICNLMAVILLSFLVYIGNSWANNKVYGPYDAAYESNYDGDTVKMLLETFPSQYMLVTLRLYGIGTPELKGGCEKSKQLAIAAKTATEKLLTEADKLQAVILGIDSFNRYLAVIIIDGKQLNNHLVSLGFAKVYDYKQGRPDWCKASYSEKTL